jgi:hypothetical protein
MWGWLSGEQTTSPRNSMLLGLYLVPAGDDPPQAALINGSWKLILGQQSCMLGQWVDELFPPSTLAWEQATGAGCDVETDTWLFDIDADPTEKNNLAASKPDLLRAMRSLMREEAATAIQYAGPVQEAKVKGLCEEYVRAHDGYLGPFMDGEEEEEELLYELTGPIVDLLVEPVTTTGASASAKGDAGDDGQWHPGLRL